MRAARNAHRARPPARPALSTTLSAPPILSLTRCPFHFLLPHAAPSTTIPAVPAAKDAPAKVADTSKAPVKPGTVTVAQAQAIAQTAVQQAAAKKPEPAKPADTKPADAKAAEAKPA